MKYLLMLLIMTIGYNSFASRTVRLTGGNTLVFNEEITMNSQDLLLNAAILKRLLLPEKETFHILIASPGGSYSTTKLIIAVLDKLPNTDIICKYCASANSYVLAVTRVKRLVLESSEVIMHEMYCSHVTALNVKDGSLDSLIEDSLEFNTAISARVKMPLDEYEKKIEGTEWTLTGKDILKYNMADELIKVDCDDYVSVLAPMTCKGK